MSSSSPPSTDPARAPSRTTRWVDRLLWIAASIAFLIALWPKKSALPTGTPAPPLELSLVGEPGNWTLQTPRERPLLIEAFASWCTACRRSNQTLQALVGPESEGRLDVLAVSVDDSPEEAARAKQNWPIPARVAHDTRGEFSRLYKIQVLPTYILIDEQGVIQDVHPGTAGATALRRWLRESPAP